MTREELMRPRWKVIAKYPGSLYVIGYIINEADNLEGASFFKQIHEYPHIFKKLEWWEERNVNPVNGLYAKFRTSIFMIIGYGKRDHIGSEVYTDRGKVFIDNDVKSEWIPATESEYNSYISKQKTK